MTVRPGLCLSSISQVAVLKARVQEAFSVAPELQKLIVAGKIIDNDEATLASFGVNEKSFIILMEKKVWDYCPLFTTARGTKTGRGEAC